MLVKHKKLVYRIVTAIILAFIFGNTFVYVKNLKTDIGTLSQRLEKTNTVLSQAVEKLVSDDERLATLEKQSSNLASAQIKIQSESATRLAILSSALSSTQSGLDLSTIVKLWRPYIARISCTIDTPKVIAETSGSALLSKTSKYPYAHLITNKHVVFYDSYTAESCKVTFPDLSGTINLSRDSISYPSKGGDIGIVDVSNKVGAIDLLAQNAVDRKICTAVSVGEKVVIIGYPGIGSKSDVTATEGIISGFDGDYYITSAKIEQGNSGGAAILIRGADTCYLGIPTFVNVGKIEALARILSAKVTQ
ncbi:MAG: trypsin-like peptidase domain-containing protein [Patescibacteria group bacterium]